MVIKELFTFYGEVWLKLTSAIGNVKIDGSPALGGGGGGGNYL